MKNITYKNLELLTIKEANKLVETGNAKYFLTHHDLRKKVVLIYKDEIYPYIEEKKYFEKMSNEKYLKKLEEEREEKNEKLI